MSNLADLIEELILRKLAGQRDDIVILKRNEIAEEIECAPSPISYVLSTRFTIDRGFIVESRRGLGGFVRIARVPIHTVVYEEAAEQIDGKTSMHDAVHIIQRLNSQGMLTNREALLLIQFFTIVFDKVPPQERAGILRQLLLSLAE